MRAWDISPERVDQIFVGLQKLGDDPNEVLPACMLICAMQAKEAGTSPEAFLTDVIALASAIWGEDFNGAKLGLAIADWAEQHAQVAGETLSPYENALLNAIRQGLRKGNQERS